ncbi:c-type cytochrome [Aestuariivirga sp.]|uniref:c-type cytochrome n=1 Tax=Aestuariivirga sp. TaxID=2650926 RepID=UPI00391D904E
MSKVILGVLTAGALTLGLASAAMAQEGPIKARQACMKANGEMMKVAVPIIKGEQPYDKAALDKVTADAEAACAGWAGWWGEDTKPGGPVETWAKEEIWTDMAGFEAAGAAYGQAFTAVKTAPDEAAFRAAFPALGKSCQDCHEKFRRPKE